MVVFFWLLLDFATFGWFVLVTPLTCCSCLILVRIVSFPALTSAFFITGEVAGRFISGFVTVSVGAGFGTGVATGRSWLLVAPAVADPFAWTVCLASCAFCNSCFFCEIFSLCRLRFCVRCSCRFSRSSTTQKTNGANASRKYSRKTGLGCPKEWDGESTA